MPTLGLLLYKLWC